MKLIDAIRSTLSTDRPTINGQPIESLDGQINAAGTFLFGAKGAYKGKRKAAYQHMAVSEDTIALIHRLGLDGDNFTLIGQGTNATVYGNGDVVFKLESEPHDADTIAYDTIPQELVARIINQGEHNGSFYSVAEQLDTTRLPTLEDIIPFLFHARDAGMVYHNPNPTNFGYDRNGILKILDHEHFEPFTSQRNFRATLTDLLHEFKGTTYPLVTADPSHIYIVLDPENATAEAGQKRWLSAALQAVTSPIEGLEFFEKPMIIRIPRRDVVTGMSAEAEDLTEILKRSLVAEPGESPHIRSTEKAPKERGYE